MKPLPVLLVLLFSLVSGQYEDCIDPPGNNAIAQVIADALEALRPVLSTGIPELGVPPLDPLGPLFDIPFNIHVPGVVKMDGTVNDTMIRNYAQFFICSVNVSLGISQKFSIEFKLQNFHMDGLYDVDGLIASLFPVFGHGDYNLDTFNTGMVGGAKISYNPLTDRAHIKDLVFDIYFDDLQLEMECILGCGEMADLVNSVVSDIAPPMFFAIWDSVNPILTSSIENVINDILKNVSISGLLPGNNTRDIGNANLYMDVVLALASKYIVQQHLDPASLPNVTFSLELQSLTELYDGAVTGFKSIHRTGTSTIDTVGDWKFLYTNIGFDSFTATYKGVATGSDGTVKDITVSSSISGVSVYLTGRSDTYSNVLDLDQFVISEFGKIDVDVDGLGPMGFLTDSIVNAVVNSLRVSISEIIGGQIKDIIQQALNENPWDDIRYLH